MGREAWQEVRAVTAAGAVAEGYVCAPAPPSSFGEHVHAEFQHYANLDVAYDYRFGRRVQTVPPGQLSLVPPGTVHGGGDPGPRDVRARFGVVYLPPDRLDALLPVVMFYASLPSAAGDGRTL